MPSNKHIIGIKARDLAFKGADDVARGVKNSMGPHGSNHLTQKGNTTTNDGYKISMFLSDSVENEFERRGALFQHAGASKVNDIVGDTTSGYFSLAEGIRKSLIPYLPTEMVPIAKKPISELRKILDRELEEVLSLLQKDIKKVSSREELVKSALVSVEDETLAEMIGGTQWDMVQEVGVGRIMVEETAEYGSTIEKINGVRIDNGFGTSYLINNPEKEALEIFDASVILTNHVIETFEPLKDLIFSLVRSGKRTIAVFAKAFTQGAMMEVSQWQQKGVGIFPMNAPYTNQGQVMLDLEAITGAKYVSDETKPLNEIRMSDVGLSKSIFAKRDQAFITGSKLGEVERVKERLATIEKDLKASNSEFYKKTLQDRISMLKGGFAILHVGSTTPEDRKRKKDKCDDAVNAVALAMQGGTVRGAGLAFKQIADGLSDDYILKNALYSIYEEIMAKAPEGFVIEDWVRDPYLSLKCALEVAIENSLNLANISSADVQKNPEVCHCNTKQ